MFSQSSTIAITQWLLWILGLKRFKLEEYLEQHSAPQVRSATESNISNYLPTHPIRYLPRFPRWPNQSPWIGVEASHLQSWKHKIGMPSPPFNMIVGDPKCPQLFLTISSQLYSSICQIVIHHQPRKWILEIYHPLRRNLCMPQVVNDWLFILWLCPLVRDSSTNENIPTTTLSNTKELECLNNVPCSFLNSQGMQAHIIYSLVGQLSFQELAWWISFGLPPILQLFCKGNIALSQRGAHQHPCTIATKPPCLWTPTSVKKAKMQFAFLTTCWTCLLEFCDSCTRSFCTPWQSLSILDNNLSFDSLTKVHD